MKHVFTKVNHYQSANPSDVELKNGMCVFLLGPTTYSKFEKWLNKENGYKKDYHRPKGKELTDFPEKDEWFQILDEFRPDENTINWTTMRHQFVIIDAKHWDEDILCAIQQYYFYDDADLIAKTYTNKVDINIKEFPDTFGIEPNVANGYLAGEVYGHMGICNNNMIYEASIINDKI